MKAVFRGTTQKLNNSPHYGKVQGYHARESTESEEKCEVDVDGF